MAGPLYSTLTGDYENVEELTDNRGMGTNAGIASIQYEDIEPQRGITDQIQNTGDYVNVDNPDGNRIEHPEDVNVTPEMDESDRSVRQYEALSSATVSRVLVPNTYDTLEYPK